MVQSKRRVNKKLAKQDTNNIYAINQWEVLEGAGYKIDDGYKKL